MAYNPTIPIVVGDTRPELVVTVRNSNSAASGQVLNPDDDATWAVVNITSATVKLYIRKVGETTLQDTITGVVADGSNGIVAFTFGSDTWTEAGVFDGEVEVTFSDGGVQTMHDGIKFKVRDEFA